MHYLPPGDWRLTSSTSRYKVMNGTVLTFAQFGLARWKQWKLLPTRTQKWQDDSKLRCPTRSFQWLLAVRICNWLSSNLIRWPPWNADIFLTLIPALKSLKHLKPLWLERWKMTVNMSRVEACCALEPKAQLHKPKHIVSTATFICLHGTVVLLFERLSFINTCQGQRVITCQKGRWVHLRLSCDAGTLVIRRQMTSSWFRITTWFRLLL